MASKSPKGYKKFGDISDIALDNLNEQLSEFREPTIKREYHEIIQKSGQHLILIFKKLDVDSTINNKTIIYLDCLNSYNDKLIFENTKITNVRYMTNFKEEMFYMIEIILT